MTREFVSKQHDAHEDKHVDFKLDGEQFNCVLRGDADSVMAWSEMAATAAGNEDDLNSAAGQAFIAQFFRQMMHGGEYQRFRAHLKAKNVHPDTLLEVMQGVNADMEELVDESMSRPTGPSSSSSGMPVDVAERRLQIISLSAANGDVEYADEAPPADAPHPKPTTLVRAPQDHKPKAKAQPRRRAG